MRTVTHNALLAAARRPPLRRYVIEGSIWAVSLGMAIGAVWYGFVLARAKGLL
ncbi:MAG: hypothetical protein V4801_02555 [Burkholderia gladioli]